MNVYGESLRNTIKKYKIEKLDLTIPLPRYKSVEEIHQPKFKLREKKDFHTQSLDPIEQQINELKQEAGQKKDSRMDTKYSKTSKVSQGSSLVKGLKSPEKTQKPKIDGR